MLPDTTVDLPTAAARGMLDSPAAVLEEFGFHRLHISEEPAYALAFAATRRLFDEHHVDPESIDGLWFAGALPSSHALDDGSPLSGFNYPAARLQYECGMMRATVGGVSQGGCAGLMTAIAQAVDHLRANARARRILCVSADVLPAGAKREIIYNVVSDGACALVVERGEGHYRILTQARINKGYYWHATRKRNEIVASYFPTARTLILDLLAEAGLKPDQIAVVIPHNVSLRSWHILLPMVGIPQAALFADNIAAKGHVIAADNFINLTDARAAGRIGDGDRLLLFTFGFGASWAGMVLAA